MEENLISKKELLDLTGISYGQLYRWKRKNLIPEDWFIRKATFTGQETFFPRDRILARVEKIKNMKDDKSLDDLAGMFSPAPPELAMTGEELIARRVITGTTLNAFKDLFGDQGVYSFDQILAMSFHDRLVGAGELSAEEGRSVLKTFIAHFARFANRSCELYLVRKLGVAVTFLSLSPSEVYWEEGTKVVARIDVGAAIEELKSRIS